MVYCMLLVACNKLLLLVVLEVEERSNWERKTTLINFPFLKSRLLFIDERQTHTEHSNFSIFHPSKLIVILFGQIVSLNKVQVHKMARFDKKKSLVIISYIHLQHNLHIIWKEHKFCKMSNWLWVNFWEGAKKDH